MSNNYSLITEFSTYIKIIILDIFLIVHYCLTFNDSIYLFAQGIRHIISIIANNFSRRVGIKTIINLLLIMNITFLLLTSLIEGLNYLGFLDLNNWDVSNLPWVREGSNIWRRSLTMFVILILISFLLWNI